MDFVYLPCSVVSNSSLVSIIDTVGRGGAKKKRGELLIFEVSCKYQMIHLFFFNEFILFTLF